MGTHRWGRIGGDASVLNVIEIDYAGPSGASQGTRVTSDSFSDSGFIK